MSSSVPTAAKPKKKVALIPVPVNKNDGENITEKAAAVNTSVAEAKDGGSQPRAKKNEEPYTHRFYVELSTKPDEYEINWLDLVEAEAKAEKNKQVEKRKARVPNFDSDDDEELKALARKYEAKYGAPGDIEKKKKKRRMEDYTDRGYGYDLNDTFIDNSEAKDETLSPTMTTKHGGFYVNSGLLEFKPKNSSEDDWLCEDPAEESEAQAEPKKRKYIKRNKDSKRSTSTDQEQGVTNKKKKTVGPQSKENTTNKADKPAVKKKVGRPKLRNPDGSLVKKNTTKAKVVKKSGIATQKAAKVVPEREAATNPPSAGKDTTGTSNKVKPSKMQNSGLLNDVNNATGATDNTTSTSSTKAGTAFSNPSLIAAMAQIRGQEVAQLQMEQQGAQAAMTQSLGEPRADKAKKQQKYKLKKKSTEGAGKVLNYSSIVEVVEINEKANTNDDLDKNQQEQPSKVCEQSQGKARNMQQHEQQVKMKRQFQRCAFKQLDKQKKKPRVVQLRQTTGSAKAAAECPQIQKKFKEKLKQPSQQQHSKKKKDSAKQEELRQLNECEKQKSLGPQLKEQKDRDEQLQQQQVQQKLQQFIQISTTSPVNPRKQQRQVQHKKAKSQPPAVAVTVAAPQQSNGGVRAVYNSNTQFFAPGFTLPPTSSNSIKMEPAIRAKSPSQTQQLRTFNVVQSQKQHQQLQNSKRQKQKRNPQVLSTFRQQPQTLN